MERVREALRAVERLEGPGAADMNASVSASPHAKF